LVGALCGVLVPEIHRIKNKNLSLGAYSTPDGGTGSEREMGAVARPLYTLEGPDASLINRKHGFTQ